MHNLTNAFVHEYSVGQYSLMGVINKDSRIEKKVKWTFLKIVVSLMYTGSGKSFVIRRREGDYTPYRV